MSRDPSAVLVRVKQQSTTVFTMSKPNLTVGIKAFVQLQQTVSALSDRVAAMDVQAQDAEIERSVLSDRVKALEARVREQDDQAAAAARDRSRSRSLRAPTRPIRMRGSVAAGSVSSNGSSARARAVPSQDQCIGCPRPAQEEYHPYCCKCCRDFCGGIFAGLQNRHGPKCSWGLLWKADWVRAGKSHDPQ